MQEASPYIGGSLHIVARLAKRIREARELGFQIRQEFLGVHQSNWCEIAGRKTVFLDAAQTAVEQLTTLDDALQTYRPAA